MNLCAPNFDMISMTKCALSNYESGQESIKNISFGYRSGCICTGGGFYRKTVCFVTIKDKKNSVGQAGVVLSFGVFEKITILARFCYENVPVTTADKPTVKHRLKGEAKISCMQFHRTAQCELV